MVDRKRRRPYVWVTWLTKLLAGEDRCVWRSWYRATHKYEKRPDDPGRADFFAKWTAKHDALQADRAAYLKGAGYIVRMEEEAPVKVEGKGGTLAGKMDILAQKTGTATLVEDTKAGRQRESDAWQVLIYQWAVSLMPNYKGVGEVQGNVVYKDQRVVPVRKVGPNESTAIANLLKTVTGSVEPVRAPSWKECRYCDVALCPDRVEAEPTGSTEMF
jgi:hypothetical protein